MVATNNCRTRQVLHGHFVQLLSLVAVVAGVVFCPVAMTQGQETETVWEYSPYRVKVWIALELTPQLGPGTLSRIEDEVVWLSEQVDLSGWRMMPESAPTVWQSRILYDLSQLQLPEEAEDRKAILGDADKLIFVAIKRASNGYKVEAREYDSTTEIMGPVFSEDCWFIHRLGRQTYRAIENAFSPLARVEEANEGRATVKMRASGLIQGPQFGAEDAIAPPTYIKDSDVMIPLIKHVGRLQLDRSQIRVLDWTCLSIEQREGDLIQCKVSSMFRSPLGSRTSRRQQRYAIVAKSGGATTTIVMHSNDKDKEPLSGYNVYYVDQEKQEPILLGKSDWRGEVTVDQTYGRFQTLYVKNGERVLSRMPLVVGYYDRVDAPVLSDEIRLRAEGIIQGLQSQFLDLVARREVYSARIRYRIGAGEFDGAEELLNELRDLPTREQFEDIINQQERLLQSDDTREQARINGMFTELRTLLLKHVSDISGQLDAELREAREGSPVEGGTPANGGAAASKPRPAGSHALS
jgi:hypothetical protein